MTLDTLRLIRNILLRSVVVGLGFTLLLAAATFGCWNCWIGMATQMFHTTESAMSNLVLDFFMAIRFFLVFILLTPALAIHWTLKRERAHTA